MPLITPKTYELAKQGINNPSLYSKNHFIFETKYDGIRAMLIVENFRISKILNRRGLDITDKFPHFKKNKFIFEEAVFDCEICVFDDLGKSRLDLIQTKEYWKDAKAILFDVLYIKTKYKGKRNGHGGDLRRKYLTTRREILEQLELNVANHNFFINEYSQDIFISETHLSFKKAQLNTVGLEGFMAKIKVSYYISGRGERWLKFPHRKETTAQFNQYELNDVGITLFNDLIRVACNGTKHSEVKRLIDNGNTISVEINYLEQTKDGKYRQPTFKRVVNG